MCTFLVQFDGMFCANVLKDRQSKVGMHVAVFIVIKDIR